MGSSECSFGNTWYLEAEVIIMRCRTCPKEPLVRSFNVSGGSNQPDFDKIYIVDM